MHLCLVQFCHNSEIHIHASMYDASLFRGLTLPSMLVYDIVILRLLLYFNQSVYDSSAETCWRSAI